MTPYDVTSTITNPRPLLKTPSYTAKLPKTFYTTQLWRSMTQYPDPICSLKSFFGVQSLMERGYKVLLHQDGHFDPPWEIEGMTLHGKSSLTQVMSTPGK